MAGVKTLHVVDVVECINMKTLKKKVVQVYSDSGHAWAKVELKELYELGLLGEISCFSYVRQQKLTSGLKVYAYLEEDCDLAKYIDAYSKHNQGTIFYFKEHHTNKRSKIRGYKNYNSDLYLRLMNNVINALKGF